MITNIIKTLHSDNFYGAGQYTEIAKGKNHYTTSFKKMCYKIKRQWLSKKRLE